ncbi:MAG: hypothetical protein II907_03605 [Firmicutes bacterium]|nr:hypothetical protein [Bacillota bacterium]
MTIDVFRCYYEAECVFAGVLRKAALMTLTPDPEAGQIRYTAAAPLQAKIFWDKPLREAQFG